MANALIYAPAGGGKTVNSTRVSTPNGKKNLLVCTDNSSMVLRNFKRENLDIVNVSTSVDFRAAYKAGYQSGKYENIILDNLSDLFDMWILEMGTAEAQAAGAPKDVRQQYQLVYQELKRLARESTACGCNTIFTAWVDQFQYTLPGGEMITRIQPKLPMKILDNVLGLMNVVGYVTSKDGKWWYITEGTQTLIAKDQIACRKVCWPEDIFTIKGESK